MTECRAGVARSARGANAHQYGFSTVELVVVLVVMGLLAAVALPRWFDDRVYAQRAWYDEVASALRFARVVAIGSGCAVRVTLAAGSYALDQQAALGGHCDPTDATWPVTVRLPDGQPAAGVAPAGVSLAPPTTFVVDAAGRTSLAGDLMLTINAATLTIHAGSGFVSQ